MIKKTVNYTDFDGNQQTETLYFNISKAELAENLDLEDRLREMKSRFESIEGDLKREHVREMLGLVKHFVKLSYGVRSEDGKRFRKSDDIWADFEHSAAYDEFLFGLFQDPTEMMDFLKGVMPADLIAQAENQAQLELEMPAEHVGTSTNPMNNLSMEELMEEMRRRKAQES